MATKRWDFRDDDLRRYSVEIEHAVLSGSRRIVVNGREIYRGGKFGDTNAAHDFDLEGHNASLRIGTNGFGYTYRLIVDGLELPTEGATIPRPARPVAQTTAAASSPAVAEAERDQAEQTVVAALAQGPDPSMLARAALVQRVEHGGRWFYWIAGLSALNFVLFALGSDLGFALGTAIDWFVDGILEELAPAFTWAAHVATIGLFVFLGLRATGGAMWAFVAGGLLYAVDALIFVLVGDWIGIVIHAFALFAIVNALLALRQLGATTVAPGVAA